MISPVDLRVIEGDIDGSSADTAGSTLPKVFVRTLSAPAGAPWDQTRVAALDARVGAPLPLGEVAYQVKRLEPWRFGRPVRFAACYVRAKEIGDALETEVEVDGRPIKLRFLSFAERSRRTRNQGTLAAAVATVSLMAIGAVASAIAIRADLDNRLSTLEQASVVRFRQAEAEQRTQEQSRALVSAHAVGHTVQDVLNDLAWASTNKVADAHLNVLHWESDFMVAEVRGDGQPFANGERKVLRAQKPLRPGVWLWGIYPQGQSIAMGPAPSEAPR